MIFRFSALKGFNLISPFNPVRRAAIYVYTHPYPLSIIVAGVSMFTAYELNGTEPQFSSAAVNYCYYII